MSRKLVSRSWKSFEASLLASLKLKDLISGVHLAGGRALGLMLDLGQGRAVTSVIASSEEDAVDRCLPR
jgi:hypothetical protein